MKEVIFRTNFSSEIGLGHIFRMKNLAYEFKRKKYKITFALDKENIMINQFLEFDFFFYKLP